MAFFHMLKYMNLKQEEKINQVSQIVSQNDIFWISFNHFTWERALFSQFYENNYLWNIISFCTSEKEKYIYIYSSHQSEETSEKFQMFQKSNPRAYTTFTMFKANFQKKCSIKNTKDINQSNLSIS